MQHFSKNFFDGFETIANTGKNKSISGLTRSGAEFCPQPLTHVSTISQAGWPAFLQPVIGL